MHSGTQGLERVMFGSRWSLQQISCTVVKSQPSLNAFSRSQSLPPFLTRLSQSPCLSASPPPDTGRHSSHYLGGFCAIRRVVQRLQAIYSICESSLTPSPLASVVLCAVRLEAGFLASQVTPELINLQSFRTRMIRPSS